MKKKRVLVVDDDESLLGVMSRLLDKAGFIPEQAQNGKSAFAMFTAEPPDLVISDIQMQQMDGLQLLHSIRRTSQIPMILITGFSKIVETQEAYKMGANGFLIKPFKKEDFLNLVNDVLKSGFNETPGNVRENQSSRYCKIPIENFVSGKSFETSIYIRLSDEKFLKIAHSGEDFSQDRIDSYKAKGICYLYLLNEDFAKYVGFNLQLASIASKSDLISNEKKLALLKHSGAALDQLIKNTGLTKELYSEAHNFIENSLQVVIGDNETFTLLELLAAHDDQVYSHSIAVSMLSVVLAKKMGWVSHQILFKVAMGGMFHDIGTKEIDAEILKKSRKDLNASEVKLLESVPTRSLEILGEIKNIPGDVIQVAYQHHESCLGNGFPRGLTHKHIHPMARLIAVANEFANLTMNSRRDSKMTPKDAVVRIVQFSGGRFDPVVLDALTSVFN